LLIVAAFTFIYAFVPNTKVRLGSALVGAIFAGLLWQTVGWVFAAYVISSTQYSAIYSAFATLIMFMIWLYVSWLILLLGAAIAFYHQHPQYTRLARGEGRLGIRSQERLALQALRVIGRSFYRAEPPWTLDRMAQEFGMPGNLMSDIVEPLERAGLIARTGSGSSPAFLPARPFDEVSAKAALDAVRDEYAPGRRAPVVTRLDQTVEFQLSRLDSGIADALKGLTLKDLALAADEGDGRKAARQAAD
ncbi:MAG: YihY family inner membrane protein, partial [Alphaproteobacteria bacterium]|nr:YihY family inner membrane protein [Alphaproteobacteria bacterium]